MVVQSVTYDVLMIKLHSTTSHHLQFECFPAKWTLLQSQAANHSGCDAMPKILVSSIASVTATESTVVLFDPAPGISPPCVTGINQSTYKNVSEI